MMTEDGLRRSGERPMREGKAADRALSATKELKAAADDVASEACAAGESVRQEVSGLGSTIKQGLSEQVERQKNGIADRLSVVAERVQRAAGDLREQEAWLGSMVSRGAAELEGVADEIRRNDVPGLLGSVEVFARRQPALFVGAAVAMGFALTRFVTGAPALADNEGDEVGEPSGGRAFEFARTSHAQSPISDSVGGRDTT